MFCILLTYSYLCTGDYILHNDYKLKQQKTMTKKNIWSLAALLVCLMSALTFTACGDDDDKSDGGSFTPDKSVTIEGLQLPSLDYVTWKKYPRSSKSNICDYEITWATYAPGTYVNGMQSAYVKVYYSASDGADGLPTGTFAPGTYSVSGYIRWNDSTIFDGFDTTKGNTANLVIEKNGSGYKVSIQDMTVVLTISKKEVKGSVAYTGSIISAQ